MITTVVEFSLGVAVMLVPATIVLSVVAEMFVELLRCMIYTVKSRLELGLRIVLGPV